MQTLGLIKLDTSSWKRIEHSPIIFFLHFTSSFIFLVEKKADYVKEQLAVTTRPSLDEFPDTERMFLRALDIGGHLYRWVSGENGRHAFKMRNEKMRSWSWNNLSSAVLFFTDNTKLEYSLNMRRTEIINNISNTADISLHRCINYKYESTNPVKSETSVNQLDDALVPIVSEKILVNSCTALDVDGVWSSFSLPILSDLGIILAKGLFNAHHHWTDRCPAVNRRTPLPRTSNFQGFLFHPVGLFHWCQIP